MGASTSYKQEMWGPCPIIKATESCDTTKHVTRIPFACAQKFKPQGEQTNKKPHKHGWTSHYLYKCKRSMFPCEPWIASSCHLKERRFSCPLPSSRRGLCQQVPFRLSSASSRLWEASSNDVRSVFGCVSVRVSKTDGEGQGARVCVD